MPLPPLRPKRGLARLAFFITVLPWSTALLSCEGPQSTLAPAGPGAQGIADLFWGVFAVAAVIFIITEGLLIYALVRFRKRPGAGEPVQTHGSTRLETAWTVAPAIILAGVFFATASTMAEVRQAHPSALQVRVVGHQWWWEVQYPTQVITTANEIHVPVGQPVTFELVSADVIHSFWVPQLSGKMDLTPGHTGIWPLSASVPGVYRGQCAEYCGTQHANMAFLVIAEPQAQFDDWVRRNQALPPAPEPGSPAARGAEAFTRAGCVGCHVIAGTNARGLVGPNLSHFGSRRGIAAETLPHTPENLARWLRDPQEVKPGNLMPKLNLSEEAIRDLVAYLESLK